MANSMENGVKDEPKTQFTAREGTYRLMTHSDYSRQNRVGYSSTGHGNIPVRVSFVTVDDTCGPSERICFNYGRELYVYVYKGVQKAVDLSKPVDKRVYKSTSPTCHDFIVSKSSPDSTSLLVGFTGGQVQLIDSARQDASNIFNDEQLIEKTRVTCVKWLPNTPHQFLASHASGHLYLYSERLPCGPAAPTYQTFKQGDGFTVYTCKARSTRNPLYRWAVGEGAVNRFEFSPSGRYLATVSQDGCLRVFRYDNMELAGVARSYFGALTCVAWSPDCRYVAAGGEDDLLTVWSVAERRVVARGRGHRSWVADVAFDPYTSVVDGGGEPASNGNGYSSDEGGAAPAPPLVTYRIGSVGQDTQLCLWELTDDVLRRPYGRSRASVAGVASEPAPPASTGSLSARLSSLGLGGEQRREPGRRLGLLLGGHRAEKAAERAGSAAGGGGAAQRRERDRLIGTPGCPRLADCPILEPHVSCRVSHERLTALTFRRDCVVTACCDGYVCTWARPGTVTGACSSSSPAATHGDTSTVV
ncbi:WD repeat-containing protein 20-like [Amphibalanus amphitrite]|uniref:WD repeat-containing protein 20-like n=1 Tax=Amphibalanus amphitrite TaxID=1232801 RepID=UPI001C903E48|nr:WD repeat-containing protein 20-like [Amphibalanus amphitrite]